jgi:hypothetical protein
MGLKVDTIQEPTSATVNLTLGTTGNVTVGANLAVAGTSTFSGSMGNITTGTINSGAITSSGLVTGTTGALYPIVSGTAQASTSGTSIDFPNIPSWVKRITVMFNGVSLSNTDSLTVQLGTGGVATTSGYTGTSTRIGASTISCNAYSGIGFEVNIVGIAASVSTGNMVITNITGNTWTCTGILAGTVTNLQDTTAGVIAMAGVVNLVRITSNGTATFDAGTINIMYE